MFAFSKLESKVMLHTISHCYPDDRSPPQHLVEPP
mgnify:CR=1 FL=1